MNKILFALLIVIAISANVYSQEKYDAPKFELKPQFRSIQIDASTIIYITKFGAALDVDIFSGKNKDKSWHSIGFRTGLDYLAKGTPGGSVSGSPFTQINGYLFRISSDTKAVRFDAYAGGAYQFSSDSYSDSKKGLFLKGGVDLKIKFTPNVGLFLNGAFCTGESYAGVGLYITYSE